MEIANLVRINDIKAVEVCAGWWALQGLNL